MASSVGTRTRTERARRWRILPERFQVDKIYHAVWNAKQSVVNFDFNFTNAPDPVQWTGVTDESFKNDERQTLPTCDRSGYTLTGWHTLSGADDDWGEEVTIDDSFPVGPASGSTTYYASWTADTSDVVFDANGGRIGEDETVTWNGHTDNPLANVGAGHEQLPTPTRTGYTFDGWFTGTGEADESGDAQWGDEVSINGSYPAGGATYTAKWTANKARIVFDFNYQVEVDGVSSQQDGRLERLHRPASRGGRLLDGRPRAR